MKNSRMLCVLALFIMGSCLDLDRPIKSATWVRVEDGKEVPFKFEFFDSTGRLVYDSTIFSSGLGYKSNTYIKGNIVLSKIKMDPGILQVLENEYDSLNNLQKTKLSSLRDTTTFVYENHHDELDRLVKIDVYNEGDMTPTTIKQFTYLGSLLKSETTLMLGMNSLDTVLKKTYAYNASSVCFAEVIHDYKYKVTDSLLVDMDRGERLTFKKIRDRGFELVLKEKFLKADSSEIEFENIRERKKTVIKRKNVEYW